MASKNILITGPPRCGKSTLIERVVRQLQIPMTGFFTKEIREDGRRVGFSITTLAGKTGVLAHQRIKGKYRVGRYGVNVGDIDKIAVPSMLPSGSDELIVIDEIGKMECYSNLFKETLTKMLSSQHQLIGSIAIKGNYFIQSIKERDDVSLIHLSEANRESAVAALLEMLR